MPGRMALTASAIVGGIGVSALVYTLVPGRSVPPPPAPALQDPIQPSLPQFSLPVNPELDTQVTAATVASAAEAMAERVRASIAADASLGGLGVDKCTKLIASVREQAMIYLGGDYDLYERWLGRSGGRRSYIEDTRTAEERAKAARDFEGSWRGAGKAIALKPIGLGNVRVRLRYLEGSPLATGDDWHVSVTRTGPDRWPALSGEPRANKYTIVEVLYPVFYFDPGDAGKPSTGTVYFGIWFVWDATAKDWRLHQTRLYNPLRINAMLCPGM